MCSDLATSDVGPGKAPMGKPDWAHVFLTVLDTLAIHSQQEQKQAATALRAAGAAVMSRHSTALRKAGVAQWELRLCVPHGMPAWRIVVSSPTGILVAYIAVSSLTVKTTVFSFHNHYFVLRTRLCAPRSMSAWQVVMSSPTVYHEAFGFVWHAVTEGLVYLDTMTHVPVEGKHLPALRAVVSPLTGTLDTVLLCFPEQVHYGLFSLWRLCQA